MLTTILIIILILILLGAFPAWPHSRGWGYGPSGVVGLILIILLILLLLGKIWRSKAVHSSGLVTGPPSARSTSIAPSRRHCGRSRKCARRSKNSAWLTIAFTVSG